MVIRPTVSFALTHPTGPAQESTFLATGRAVLSVIPGVDDLIVPRQVSPKSHHRFQFARSFAAGAVRRAYDDHPDHRRFVTEVWDSEVVDFQELDLVPLPAAD